MWVGVYVCVCVGGGGVGGVCVCTCVCVSVFRCMASPQWPFPFFKWQHSGQFATDGLVIAGIISEQTHIILSMEWMAKLY